MYKIGDRVIVVECDEDDTWARHYLGEVGALAVVVDKRGRRGDLLIKMLIGPAKGLECWPDVSRIRLAAGPCPMEIDNAV